MGAVLLQEDSPIAYASKTLTPCQQNYAQIEKEMLAIVFGCTKFHDYIYGLQNIRIETDHKPLESILTKPLYRAPARLQRMIMSVQRYPITVEYKAGKELYIADTLSRAPLSEQAVGLEFKQYDINYLQLQPISESRASQLRQETMNDEGLQELMHIVQNGWPSDKSQTPIGARPYWSYRDEISLYDGVLFKGNRIIIPTSMRKEMLKRVHDSHLGIEKCKQRARDIIYWPGMITQIEDMVSSCTVCAKYSRRNTRQPLMPHDIPERPWEKVGADLCELHGKTYLVMVDYYSNFIEVDHVKETKSSNIIKLCKAQFTRHGIPDTVITDNGPQFSSEQFREFASSYQFKHCTSSPHFPQSNGKAEKAVQVVKNILKKASDDNQDPFLALLAFRNTPMDDQTGSPAQQLMGRRTKTLLPTSRKLLLPGTIRPSRVRRRIVDMKQRQKKYYDRLSKTLNPLKPGDKVLMQSNKQSLWIPAKVCRKLSTPRSYLVTTQDGQTYRRNRGFLRKTSDRDLDEYDDDGVTNVVTVPMSQDISPNQEGQTDHQTVSLSPPLRRSTRSVTRPEKYADRYASHF